MIIFPLLFTTPTAVCAKTVSVAGSGGMIPLLTVLADAHMKRYPHDNIKISKNSLTQSGGILAVKNGSVDIGMSARLLDVQELDFSVDAYHIANVAAVAAVNNNVRLTNITSQQLCDIYAGKITNWSELGGHDAQIVVLTKPDNDSTKQAFRTGIACFSKIEETPRAITMFKSNDMQKVLERTEDAIGIIDSIALAHSHGKTHLLRLDNRNPSPEEIRSGMWPVIKKYTLVIKKNRSKAVDRFMQFIKSKDGAALILRNNGIPVKFSYP